MAGLLPSFLSFHMYIHPSVCLVRQVVAMVDPVPVRLRRKWLRGNRRQPRPQGVLHPFFLRGGEGRGEGGGVGVLAERRGQQIKLQDGAADW